MPCPDGPREVAVARLFRSLKEALQEEEWQAHRQRSAALSDAKDTLE